MTNPNNPDVPEYDLLFLYSIGKLSPEDQAKVAYLLRYHETLYQYNLEIPKITFRPTRVSQNG